VACRKKISHPEAMF